MCLWNSWQVSSTDATQTWWASYYSWRKTGWSLEGNHCQRTGNFRSAAARRAATRRTRHGNAASARPRKHPWQPCNTSVPKMPASGATEQESQCPTKPHQNPRACHTFLAEKEGRGRAPHRSFVPCLPGGGRRWWSRDSLESKPSRAALQRMPTKCSAPSTNHFRHKERGASVAALGVAGRKPNHPFQA